MQGGAETYYLQGQQQQECLYTVESTVNEISKEQVVCVRALSADLEQLNKVVELSVNIATNLRKNKVDVNSRIKP